MDFPVRTIALHTLLHLQKVSKEKRRSLVADQRYAHSKETSILYFENVDRLLKSPAKQRGRDFGIILSCLAELGYSVEWRVVNAALYGAAQRRRRTFILHIIMVQSMEKEWLCYPQRIL